MTTADPSDLLEMEQFAVLAKETLDASRCALHGSSPSPSQCARDRIAFAASRVRLRTVAATPRKSVLS